MRISRVRLKLAAWFGLVFLVGISLVDLALYRYLHEQADLRFTRSLQGEGVGLGDAIGREFAESHATDLRGAVADALAEWPASPHVFVVYDAAGGRLAAVGGETLARDAPARIEGAGGPGPMFVSDGDRPGWRWVVARRPASPTVIVRVGGSTARVQADAEALVWWFVVSAPLLIVLALAAGYLLAGRALRPVSAMASAISRIAPDDLDRRLPLRDPPDELDALAEQFNRLLERLARANAQNLRFLGEAAHQLRTPLTVILGESSLGADGTREGEQLCAALRRVRLAAEQMTRRVDELFLLAEAEAGMKPALAEQVELDGLALECADLMRARASALSRRLELERIESAQVRGDEPLLREALLELIENACRHSSASSAIGISAFAFASRGRLEVTGEGPLLAADVIAGGGPSSSRAGRRLGLSIAAWIASSHGGRLIYERRAGANAFVIDLPLAPDGSDGHAELPVVPS